MLYRITSVFAIFNLLFLLAGLSSFLLNSEAGWFHNEPLIGIFFAYVTIFLEPTTIDLLSNKFKPDDDIWNNDRTKYNLVIGTVGLAYFGIVHLLTGSHNRDTLSYLWYLGLILLPAVRRWKD